MNPQKDTDEKCITCGKLLVGPNGEQLPLCDNCGANQDFLSGCCEGPLGD